MRGRTYPLSILETVSVFISIHHPFGVSVGGRSSVVVRRWSLDFFEFAQCLFGRSSVVGRVGHPAPCAKQSASRNLRRRDLCARNLDF